jgi:hypothetical protein
LSIHVNPGIVPNPFQSSQVSIVPSVIAQRRIACGAIPAIRVFHCGRFCIVLTVLISAGSALSWSFKFGAE